MMIFIQLRQQLQSLNNLISLLNNNQYSTKIEHLGKSSIGEHVRHIIELLQCAINGYSADTIDYVNRNRNLDLQKDKKFAQIAIEQILLNIEFKDKRLNMVLEKNDDPAELKVNTTYYREIVYNTEHTIHHLALIKVALIEMDLNIVNDNFGMAYSTIKYKQALNNSN